MSKESGNQGVFLNSLEKINSTEEWRKGVFSFAMRNPPKLLTSVDKRKKPLRQKKKNSTD
jgi:hypothetical protein